MDGWIQALAQAGEEYLSIYISIMRYLAPALTVLLLLRCAWPLLTFRRMPEIWGWLKTEDGDKYPINHWENVIGRDRSSDIVMPYPTVSKTHAVLTRYDDGSWSIADIGSSGGITLNGEAVRISALEPEDDLAIGGIHFTLHPISQRQEKRLIQLRTGATGWGSNAANLMLLTVFQLLVAIGYLMGAKAEYAPGLLKGFASILAAQWGLLIFYGSIRRSAFEVETLAFFLCTMGMAAIAATKPWEAEKQAQAMLLGILTFLLVGWSLRNLERAKVFRYPALLAGIAFLVITLVFGTEYKGAKNWLIIGSLSLQPSELSKVCFVYAGASSLDRILNRRNILGLIAYALAICACLALMNDFGTALIFFAAFLIMAFLRSGSVGTVALACSSLGFAGVLAVKIAPHALRRFQSWRHIWEMPLDGGYQQTRALMCMAAGGLFGLGPNMGWMKKLFASDSDMVFATLGEEWGLVMAVLAVLCVVVLTLFALRSAGMARSTFFTIAGCTAAGILLVQMMLNVLGAVDVLPLTGVTFPFVSNGGTSMISVWGLLAFIKAMDTRQNASFAVRIHKGRREADE